MSPALPRFVVLLSLLFLPGCHQNVASPIPTTGLQLWLRADAGVTLKGSTVSRWADQSGNGNHATQLDHERRPLFVRAALNGNPALRFDGGDDRLGLTGTKRMSQISVFMVFQPHSGGDGCDPIIFGDIDADGQVWGVDMQSRFTGYSPDTINIYAGFVQAVAPGCAAFDRWHIIDIITDRVIWNTTLRVNGVDAYVRRDYNNISISIPLGDSAGTGVGGDRRGRRSSVPDRPFCS
jgi:hypothetical protein